MTVWDDPRTENPVPLTVELSGGDNEFERFQDLAQSLLAVPKAEIDAARAEVATD